MEQADPAFPRVCFPFPGPTTRSFVSPRPLSPFPGCCYSSIFYCQRTRHAVLACHCAFFFCLLPLVVRRFLHNQLLQFAILHCVSLLPKVLVCDACLCLFCSVWSLACG
ncbi:hypothetical protein BCV70DRAFT_116488 [Testicularia cyperi]|uniref:Transmembrane protein n=1 Tax=Testicularia cyperi TaxID=1882483 RepID=A0A317XNA8_9BASI|nr:hypothetical protein BCV70DRAFT_116488 [Testicularia cyperi]